MVKLLLSESLVQSSLDAIRIHGGYGYMTENGIERDLRDAIAEPHLLRDLRHPAQPDRPPHAACASPPDDHRDSTTCSRPRRPPAHRRGHRRRAGSSLRRARRAVQPGGRMPRRARGRRGRPRRPLPRQVGRGGRRASTGSCKAGAAYVPLDPAAPRPARLHRRRTAGSAASSPTQGRPSSGASWSTAAPRSSTSSWSTPSPTSSVSTYPTGPGSAAPASWPTRPSTEARARSAGPTTSPTSSTPRARPASPRA